MTEKGTKKSTAKKSKSVTARKAEKAQATLISFLKKAPTHDEKPAETDAPAAIDVVVPTQLPSSTTGEVAASSSSTMEGNNTTSTALAQDLNTLSVADTPSNFNPTMPGLHNDDVLVTPIEWRLPGQEVDLAAQQPLDDAPSTQSQDIFIQVSNPRIISDPASVGSSLPAPIPSSTSPQQQLTTPKKFHPFFERKPKGNAPPEETVVESPIGLPPLITIDVDEMPVDNAIPIDVDEEMDLGNTSDPVIISEIRVQPKKPKLASGSSKRSGPLFSVTTSGAKTANGNSSTEPIDLSDSPAKPGPAASAKSQAAAVAHPFFARTKPAAGAAAHKKSPSSTWTQKTEHVALPAPWPTKETQHVAGEQHPFGSSIPSAALPRRQPRPRSPSTASVFTYVDSPTIVAPPTRCVQIAEGKTTPVDIPIEHLAHPALARLQNIPSSGLPWSDKYRPTTASQVLGNEEQARYLKSWLQALEIQLELPEDPQAAGPSKKRSRPQIVRAVSKKKRRLLEGEFSWVVDDVLQEDSISDWDLDSRGSSPPRFSPPFRPSASPGPVSAFSSGQLTNTIMLSGPAGSAKTAAVYACADELGWGIFEVYPGVGKRSGVGLQTLVGDAVNNHLVLGKARGAQVGKGKQKSMVDGDHFGFIEEAGVRQSLILLEEVDVLFEEDRGFWNGVVNLIKQSKRPFIMTCNDMTLVPTDDLPLQTTLEFTACEPELATSYLQAVAATEGRVVDRDSARQIYSQIWKPISADVPDEPRHPLPYQLRPTWDLRRSLNQLQFACSGLTTIEGDVSREGMADWSLDLALADTPPIEQTTNEPYGLLTLHRLCKMAECMSFSDAFLSRRAWDTIDAEAIDRFQGGPDDELAHFTLLPKVEVELAASRGRRPQLAMDQRDDEIATEVECRARKRFEEMGGGVRCRAGAVEMMVAIDSDELDRRRAAYQETIVGVLDSVISLSSPLLPRAGCVLDYVPACVGILGQPHARVARDVPVRTTRSHKVDL